MPKFTANELKAKSDEALATEAERHDIRSSEGMLIDREFKRRLMKQQVIFSVILSAIMGMVGIVGGVFLQYHLEKNRGQNMLKIHQHINISMEAPKHPK